MEFRDWGIKALDFIEKPIEEDAFINILEGSVRSGKTVAMIPKWLNYIMTGPPGLLLMTGVSKDTIYDNVLNDLFDTIGEENYHYNRQSGSLDVFWRDADGEHVRRIKVVGAKDEGSEKFIRGKTLAGAYCDELTLMPERFFKQLLNRLSVPGAKLYSTTNPDSPPLQGVRHQRREAARRSRERGTFRAGRQSESHGRLQDEHPQLLFGDVVQAHDSWAVGAGRGRYL